MTTFVHIAVALLCLGDVKSLERAFVYCPAYPCTCEPSEGASLIINCRSLYLSAPPKFLSFEGRIKEMSLRHNSIQNLPASSFQGLHIEKLDLLDNAVTYIHNAAFSGLEDSLESLSLQLYAMYGLPTLAFSRLFRLKILIVSGCWQKEVGAELFTNLTGLSELHLVGCRIANIRPDAFSLLTRLKTLILSQNSLHYKHLTEINKLDNLTILDLSSNYVKHLDNMAFSRLTKLRSLNLGSNKLTHVAKQAFYNLDVSLETLDLRNNFINEEALDSLEHLKLLRHVDLSQNKISNLEVQYFARMRYLESLRLANNNIKVVKRQSFKGLGLSIRELDLHGNPLQVIESGTFSRFKVLEKLNLSSTSLGGTLQPNTFNGLTDSLKSLSVSNSRLVSADIHSLSIMTAVTDLDLSNNQIAIMDILDLNRMVRLQRFDLSRNNISSFLTGNMTMSASPLKSLDLSWNNIQAIQDCGFFVFKQLTDVHLEGNPLVCNCSLSWLYRWLQMPHAKQNKDSHTWTCSNPVSLVDYHISELEFSDFKCPDFSRQGERCLSLHNTPSTLESVREARIFHLHAAQSCGEICLNITRRDMNTVNVQWMTEGIEDVHGFKVTIKRHNDSYPVQSVTVSGTAVDYVFRHDSMADLDACVAAFTETFATQVEGCQAVPLHIEGSGSSTKNQLGILLHNSFLPLIFIYVSCTLAAVFFIAFIATCIQRKKRKGRSQQVKPFYLTYHAWNNNRSFGSSLSLPDVMHFFKSSFTDDTSVHDTSVYHTQSTILPGLNAPGSDDSSIREDPSVRSGRREYGMCSRGPSCICNIINPPPALFETKSPAERNENEEEFYFQF